MTWKRSTVWAALGIVSAQPSEQASATSRVTSRTACPSPPRYSSWAASLAGAPLSLPAVKPTTRLPSRSHGRET